MNPHFFTAPFYFAFIWFRVQGSGLSWRLRRLFLEDGILVSQPSPPGNAIKLSGRTFLAPHRGSCPKGLCKRTGFLGVKRRENPVRRHFERSEMRGLRSGIAGKCWNIDSIGLFNIARYTASMPLLPSALPPKGEARRYVANDFLNLIALPPWGRFPDHSYESCKSPAVDGTRK